MQIEFLQNIRHASFGYKGTNPIYKVVFRPVLGIFYDKNWFVLFNENVKAVTFSILNAFLLNTSPNVRSDCPEWIEMKHLLQLRRNHWTVPKLPLAHCHSSDLIAFLSYSVLCIIKKSSHSKVNCNFLPSDFPWNRLIVYQLVIECNRKTCVHRPTIHIIRIDALTSLCSSVNKAISHNW